MYAPKWVITIPPSFFLTHDSSLVIKMGNKHSSSPEVTAAVSSSSSIPPANLLHGCSTLEEHNEIIRHVISSSLSSAQSSIGGEEQLKTLGFEYRFVPCCSAHASHDIMNENNCHQCATRLFYVGRQGQRKRREEQRENKHVDAQDDEQSNADKVCNKKQKDENSEQQKQRHQEEDAIMITPTNRQQFIANGAMYDAIATCSQQVVHDKMCTAFDLQWVTVCDEQQQHIRALVDKDHTMLLEEDENRWVVQELLMNNDNEEKKDDDDDDDDDEDEDSSAMIKSTSKIKPPTSTNRTKATLLIATGRGKVRAGIFSRHHRKLVGNTGILYFFVSLFTHTY